MTRKDTDAERAERALFAVSAAHEAPGAWALRLARLAAPIAPLSPPAHLLTLIDARVDARISERKLAAVHRSLARWRLAALVGATLASAALFSPWVSGGPKAPGGMRVAVVTADADPTLPGMVVAFEPASGRLTVVPLIPRRSDDSAFEMWHLPKGADRPRSLGLLPAGPTYGRRIEAGKGDLFAISREPAGGSPTGRPTVPLYHGRLVRVPP